MPWKKRGRYRYYYKNERVGRRVVSHYIGRGELAGLVEAQVEAGKRLRTSERRLKALREAPTPADRDLEELSASAELLVRVSLIAAGYHRHHRGEWRKRRVFP